MAFGLTGARITSLALAISTLASTFVDRAIACHLPQGRLDPRGFSAALCDEIASPCVEQDVLCTFFDFAGVLHAQADANLNHFRVRLVYAFDELLLLRPR